MSEFAGFAITILVAIAVATTGIVVVEQMDLDWNQQACDVKLGEDWEYVNGTENLTNQTIVCESPSGRTERVGRELNLTNVPNTAVFLPEA